MNSRESDKIQVFSSCGATPVWGDFQVPKGTCWNNYRYCSKRIQVFHLNFLNLFYFRWFQDQPAHKNNFIEPGISESERQRRNESNQISTEINFAAWIIEVPPSLIRQACLSQILWHCLSLMDYWGVASFEFDGLEKYFPCVWYYFLHPSSFNHSEIPGIHDQVLC